MIGCSHGRIELVDQEDSRLRDPVFWLGSLLSEGMRRIESAALAGWLVTISIPTYGCDSMSPAAWRGHLSIPLK